MFVRSGAKGGCRDLRCGGDWRNAGFSFEFGGASKTKDGVSPVLAYSWDTSKIKDPLFAFLEGHGWKRKKGLFG